MNTLHLVSYVGHGRYREVAACSMRERSLRVSRNSLSVVPVVDTSLVLPASAHVP